MLTRADAQAALLQVVVDTVPVGIVIAEAPSGRIVRVNPRMCEIMGSPIPGGPCTPLHGLDLAAEGRPLAPQDHPLTQAVAGHATRGTVAQLGRSDGDRSWVRIDGAPIHDAGGQVIGGIIAVTCIRAEREAQTLLEHTVATRTAALARSTARNQALFDHSPFDIIVAQVARSGPRVGPILGEVTIEVANAAFCHTTGWSPDSLRLRPLEAALGPQTGATIAADCRMALQHGDFECQHTLAFPVGDRLVRTFYRVLPEETPDFHRVLVTQVDVTEVRRVEVARRQAMRLEAIGQLTGGVAHDFNNLLTAVQGNLELLASKVTDKRQQRWVQTALTATQRGATLTQQLMAYARKQFLEPVATDIPAAVSGMTELIRGSLGARISLTTEFAARTWPALADPAQLELALLNLVVNARDAMRLGGSLSLSTDNCARAHANLPSELEPRDYVRLRVADTGIGMPPEVLARAVEPFFTTKQIGEGSGLGLSQAYGYARQLGGTLRLHSAVGQGTAAEMFLPRA